MSANPRAFAVTLPSVLAIALPMTLAHITTPFIGMTDTAVIGQLGSAALVGAVALGALLMNVVSTTFNFLRMGTTGLVAQAMGAGDTEGEALTLWRALLIALIGGVVVIVLQRPIADLFFAAMGASEAVNAATRTYFEVRVWGMPIVLANYAILGWLLGLGRAGTGLAIQFALSLTNIVLSIALVLGAGAGIAGVAAASVAAEVVALAFGTIVVLRAGLARPILANVLQPAGLKRMAMVNRDILIRSALLVATFSFFTSVGARFGDQTLAANAILMNIFMISTFFLDGLATAAEQLGGRAVGAGHRPAFDQTVRLTLVAGVMVCVPMAGFWLAMEVPFLTLMTASDDLRAVAAQYLPWAALTPIAGMLAFVMDGVFIGATWTVTMRNMMIVAAAAFVAMWWLLTPHLGNHGLWLAFLIYLAVRGLTLLFWLPRMANRTFR